MKPVDKGTRVESISNYPDAKPELLNRIGLQCSYCEEAGSPQTLHVEHIYPKKPHPKLKLEWDNFLISCTTCNSYKNIYQGSARQADLEDHHLWPHLDNTYLAFNYYNDGRIEVHEELDANIAQLAEATIGMVGLMKRPGQANDYSADIAYDGMSKRSESWEIAEEIRTAYLISEGSQSAESLARIATKMGHFSIWMEVFRDHIEVRHELVRAFKADPTCFDNNTDPVTKGRL